MKHLSFQSLCAVSLVLASLSLAEAVPCSVGFDSAWGLSTIPEQARAAWAVPPYYRQPCGAAVVHVDEGTGQGHYHLAFEDPSIGACFVDEGFGRLVNGACVAPNWIREPRRLVSHTGQQWIRIYIVPEPGRIRTFQMTRITVGSTPIELWGRKTNGDWIRYSELAPGIRFLSTGQVLDVWVRAARGSAVPYTLHGFSTF